MKALSFFLVLALTLTVQASFLKTQLNEFVSETIVLNPGDTKSFSNPLPFQVSATCAVVIATSNDKVCGTLTSGSGSINGQNFNQGQSSCFDLTNGENLSVVASGSATIQFTNDGSTTVTLNCNANLQEDQKQETNFISQTITINPGQTTSFQNPLPFSVSASCTVSDGGSDNVCGTLTSGSGSLNGQNFNQGQQACFVLTNGESLSVQASGSANIQFTNQGSTTVTLNCNANLEEEQKEETSFISQTITINPGQTTSFQNPLPFSVSASCTVSDGGSDNVCGTLTSGSGSLNGQNFNQGQQACFVLTNGESLSVQASGSANIQFTNQGSTTVTLNCDANLQEEQKEETNFISQTITINPGQTTSFQNPLPFSVSASCTVSDGGSDNVCGTLTSGSGSLNGQNFNQGQQACFVLTNGESLSVQASGSADIQFTNNGSNTVTLNCNANLQEDQQDITAQQ